jgi:hypothetical protein
MSVVRKLWPADWRSVVVTVADVSTPKGLVRVRFIYDKASRRLFYAIPGAEHFKELGLTRGQTDELLKKAKKECLWRVALHEKGREKKERAEEQRAKELTRTGKNKQTPKKQQELPF